MISLTADLAYSKKATFQGHEVKEGEILVRFKPSANVIRINSITKSIGAQVLYTSSSVKNQRSVIIPNFYVLKVDGVRFTQSLGTLAASSDVEWAEPNYKLSALTIPDDEYFGYQWALDNVGQTGGTPDADINAPGAWDRKTGSHAVVVATVDTGVDYNHPDLAGNMWVNQSEIPGNGLDDDNNGYIDDIHGINVVDYYIGGALYAGDPMDDMGHGTHVAGIIGACGNNSQGISGVNWNVSIMATKFLNSEGYGWMDDAILCLEYIVARKRAGVNIIAANNSWGGGGYSRALYDAIKALQSEGILFIAAAGNEGLDNDSDPAYPASYDLMNIISVAATDHNDELTWYSNSGKRTVDVGAPGDSILSTCSYLLPYCWSTEEYPYDLWSGTSMAAPHVSGLAALLKAQNQTRSWKAIRNLILSTGDSIPTLDGHSVTGKRIDAERALTSPADARLFAILSPANGMRGALYSPIDLEVHDILGANPVGPVTCKINSTTVNLLDNGIFPDKVAQDGVFSARWTPPRIGDFALIFKSGSLSQTINVSVSLLPPRYTIGEIPHEFTDISATGAPLNLVDDGYQLIYPLPFPLTIYGEPTDYLFVFDNGGVSIDTWIDWDNMPIPNVYYGNLMVPFWDDLCPRPEAGTGQDVYWQINGSAPNQELIIQWNDMPHYNLLDENYNPLPGTDGVTFQMVFHEDRPEIEYRYKDVVLGASQPTPYDFGSSATIGAQKDGENASQFSFNTSSLRNNYSLELVASDAAYPQLSVEPDYLDFGCVLKGKSKDQPVYLYNKGNIPLNVSSVALNGTAEYKLATKLPSGGLNIPAGQYGKIMVRYTPINEGSDYASLTVKSTGGMCSISVYGWGMLAPDIDLPGALIDFGEVAVGGSYEKELTIQNKGNASLRIDYIDIDAPFSIEGGLPPYELAPGGSITITLSFSPEEGGTFTYSMAIFSNDPDEAAVIVPLAGVGWP